MDHGARLQAVSDALEGCGRILLTGPIHPDGDSVGACLALADALRRRHPEARVAIAGDPGPRYGWMPGADAMLPDAEVAPDWDAVVVLDGDRLRLEPPVEAAFAAARVTGLVDHHRSSSTEGYTVAWLDPSATSTCQMVYDALVAHGDPLSHTVATGLYVGTIFDTGGFRYSNTTPATHRMAAHLLELGVDHADANIRVLVERRLRGVRAAGSIYTAAREALSGRCMVAHVTQALQQELGLVQADLEGIVDRLVYVPGVACSALFIEKPPADDGTPAVKVSLRSRGEVDVAAVARSLAISGGGHEKAAGALMLVSPAEAERAVLLALSAALDGSGQAL